MAIIGEGFGIWLYGSWNHIAVLFVDILSRPAAAGDIAYIRIGQLQEYIIPVKNWVVNIIAVPKW